MRRYLFLALLVLGILPAHAKSLTAQERLRIAEGDYELDEKKSSGEFCQNLSSPVWSTGREGEVLRLGPHLFFSSFDLGTITDRDSDTDCIYEFETKLIGRRVEKTLEDKCKKPEQNSKTVQKLHVTDKALEIEYRQTRADKPAVTAHCYLLLQKKDSP